MNNSKIICVLGPARCGTSLTARILSYLGVYLGPKDHMLIPNVNNPKGFWEHSLIHEMDWEILSRLGGTWHNPPVFHPGWEKAPEINDLKARARTIIKRDFSGVKVWGWKHPPTCLTLPFWKDILQPMHYVICLRNPLDSARSLNRMNGFSLEKGFYLWLLYVKFALEHTANQQRTFVFSENWVNDWQSELYRLSRFLGNAEMAKRADVRNAVEKSIDKNLWHHDLSGKVLSASVKVYENCYLNKPFLSIEISNMLQEALEPLEMEAKMQEAYIKRKEYEQWQEQLKITIQEISMIVSPKEKIILVDESRFGSEISKIRNVIPFPERNGQYYGLPPDDRTAILEFERLRHTVIDLLVFGWPAFWWLDYYAEFHNYLRSKFRCVLKNERLIVFDLR